MPARDGQTSRRWNGEFYHGATIDGTFKSLAPNRGGFVEYNEAVERQATMAWPYGLHAFPSTGADKPLSGVLGKEILK